MKPLLLFILLKCSLLCAQSDSIIFDKDFIFRNGIYSGLNEVLTNSPKYPDVVFELKENRLTKTKTLYANKTIYSDSIYAIVQDGKLSIKFENDYRKLILSGSISTFFIETRAPNSLKEVASSLSIDSGPFGVRNNPPNVEIYCLDLKTGFIDLLTCDYMDEILQRDYSLYTDFSLASRKEKKKTLYSYVLKFNSRNPTYFRK